jgi:hypothetical protein
VRYSSAYDMEALSVQYCGWYAAEDQALAAFNVIFACHILGDYEHARLELAISWFLVIPALDGVTAHWCMVMAPGTI